MPPPRRPPPPPSRFQDRNAPPAVVGATPPGAQGVASKEQNIYIPSFIAKRPFYAGDTDQADYLDHQRAPKKSRPDDPDSESHFLEAPTTLTKPSSLLPARTKYKKGACENCGADGHKAKDCLHRQRKKGAKWTGSDIQADDVSRENASGWDAKRDRWRGYDPKEYKKTVAKYEELEELKRLALTQERQRKAEDGLLDDDNPLAAAAGAANGDDDDEGGAADDKYAEENDMSRHQSTATKQLRIREDTAKYLLNLDLESAKYDPKTRSLVNPGATSTTDAAAALFAEEGFARGSGDAAEFERAQRYAWENQEKTGETGLHLQANPTAGEISRKKLQTDEDTVKKSKEAILLEKYGSTKQQAVPAELREMMAPGVESEKLVEYDELGLVKGAPRTMAKSKYVEDVHINNHTSVWGSWWKDFRWGYACCHSMMKQSYCTGEDGIKAFEAAERQKRTGITPGQDKEDGDGEEQGPVEEAWTKDKSRKGKALNEDAKNPDEEEIGHGVTEKDMDEYRRKRPAANDPMAKFLGKDDSV